MDREDRLCIVERELNRLAAQGIVSAQRMQELVAEVRQECESMSHEHKGLGSLYQIARELAETFELDQLLESIVDQAIVLVDAERGYVVLGNDPESYCVGAARRFEAGELGVTSDSFSSSLVRRVMTSRKPLLTSNVQTDGRFELSQSIIAQDIRSVLAVPMVGRGELQGAIYVDTRASVREFARRDLELLEAMASHAAVAVASAQLLEDAITSRDELQRALQELRSTQDQLIESERMAAVGRLAASVAHELRNPLSVMRNQIYYLHRLVTRDEPCSPEMVRHGLDRLDAEIDRQNKIINDLLFFSRNRPRKLMAVHLAALLDETLMRISMPESIEVVRDYDDNLDTINADSEQLEQVFVNLISNAVEAMPDGGQLSVRAELADEWAIVRIGDTGAGIAHGTLERLFDPFFTTKQNGIGLGLSVTRSIVEGHRGTIEVESESDQGTTFTVRLPRELIG